MSDSTPEQLAKTLAAFFATVEAVSAAYLFGSAARGELRPDSDLDVAILPCADLDDWERMDLRLNIAQSLEERLGRRVDAVDLTDAPCHLVHQVLLDKVILKGRQSAERVAFEVASRRQYFDSQARRERYANELFRRVLAGGDGPGQRKPSTGTLAAARRVYRRLARRSGR